MADRWPTVARVVATDSDCTIILPTDSATCRMHVDGASQVLSFTEGVPVGGNGHPAEGAATHYARCPTCNRLCIVVPNDVSYSRVSHRLDLSVLTDTFLSEGDEDTAKGGLSSISLNGAAGNRDFPAFSISPIRSFLPSNPRILKAELRVYASAISGAPSYDGYKLIPGDFTAAQATWNVRKSGGDWNTPGALGDDTDRDTSGKYSSAAVLPGGTGWKSLASGVGFTEAVAARLDETWHLGIYGLGSSATFNSVEAGADRPILRVWYEGHR